MSDQCKHCKSRGDLTICRQTECFHHENWYAVEMEKENEALKERVRELEEALVQIIDGDDCGVGRRIAETYLKQ